MPPLRLADVSPGHGRAASASRGNRGAAHRFAQVGWLLLLLLLGTRLGLAQGTVHLVLSGSTPPYEEFTSALREALQSLPSPPEVRRLAVEGYTASAAAEAGLWVAVGTRAATRLGQVPPRGPVLLTLVPREALHQALKDPAWRMPLEAFSALYIDQPFSRQLALIRAAIPAAERVLALFPPESALSAELQHRAEELDLEARLSVLEDPKDLIPTLSGGLQDVQAFLALPDPRLGAGRGIQSLLLATYRHGVPVFAYSHSYVDAGAAAAVYSTPAQLGRHAGEVIAAQLAPGRRPLPGPSYPRYFEVAVNARVARSLGLPVADAEHLKRAISSAEGEGTDE